MINEINKFENPKHLWTKLNDNTLKCISCQTLKFELGNSTHVYRVGFNHQWTRNKPICLEDLVKN